MKDYKEIAWLMERTLHKYIQYEKIPQPYGDNLILTQAEIHTIVIVGDQEGINVTQVAKIRGITKGAASQMIYKLVDKGLVEKRISPDSDSAVSLYLTEKGQWARTEHRKKHETIGVKFAAFMSDIPEGQLHSLVEFLKAFEKELDELP